MKKVLSERERRSVVPGGNAGELGVSNGGGGVYRVPTVNRNDADAPDNPAQRVSRSESTCRCRKFAIDPTCERHGRR